MINKHSKTNKTQFAHANISYVFNNITKWDVAFDSTSSTSAKFNTESYILVSVTKGNRSLNPSVWFPLVVWCTFANLFDTFAAFLFRSVFAGLSDHVSKL